VEHLVKNQDGQVGQKNSRLSVSVVFLPLNIRSRLHQLRGGADDHLPVVAGGQGVNR